MKIEFNIPNEDAPGYLKRELEKAEFYASYYPEEGGDRRSFQDRIDLLVEYLKGYLKDPEDAGALKAWLVDEATGADIKALLESLGVYVLNAVPPSLSKQVNAEGEA